MKRSLVLFLFVLLGLAVTSGSPAARIGSVVVPEIVSFTATPHVINPGDTVTVSWETRGVDSVTMEWGPEYHPRGGMQMRMGLPPLGTMTDQPGMDTVYVLEC